MFHAVFLFIFIFYAKHFLCVPSNDIVSRDMALTPIEALLCRFSASIILAAKNVTISCSKL